MSRLLLCLAVVALSVACVVGSSDPAPAARQQPAAQKGSGGIIRTNTLATPSPAPAAPVAPVAPTPTPAPAPAAPAAGATGAVAGPVIPNVGDHGRAVPGTTPNNGAVLPNGVKVPPGTPKGAFPYTFPYSQARHIVSDFSLQRIRLYDGAQVLKEWKMSSGKFGIGFKNDFAATPSGKFTVVMKVGGKQPSGMIIEKLTPQGRIGYQSDKFAHMQTRILVLSGVDKNANYDNTNTRARSIYIHGTNKEKELGTMQSHGCFRMGNADVIELFDLVQTGVEYFAVPFGAWPN
jgi:L,D-transpeptidase YbiS